MDPRLVAIEEKLAHLERHIGELDGVVRDMNDRFDGFQRQMRKMRADLETQRAGGGSDGDGEAGHDLEEDKPPHW